MVTAETTATAAGITRGVLLMLVSETAWVTMNAIIKGLSDTYPLAQLLFFRNIVAVPVMLAIVLATGGPALLRIKRPGLHLVHVCIAVTGVACLIFSLGHLGLSEAIAVTYMAPLMMTALSVPVLKERVGLRRWSAIVIGFMGVLVLARPGVDFKPVVLVLLFGTFLFSCVVVIRRILSRTDHSAAVVLYFTVAGSIAGGIAMIWWWVPPDAWGWALLLASGACAAVAQLSLTGAIKAAPVSVISPMLYCSLVLGVGIDILFWGVHPDGATYLGAGIIVVAGLYNIFRDAQRARRRGGP